MQYPATTQNRAMRALRCSPFCRPLFVTMQERGVALAEVVGAAGVSNHFTQVALSELGADAKLGWLMQVGLLRREVDGQGLTDSFRLTPLGRQVLEQWQPETWPVAQPQERLWDLWHRFIHLSFG